MQEAFRVASLQTFLMELVLGPAQEDSFSVLGLAEKLKVGRVAGDSERSVKIQVLKQIKEALIGFQQHTVLLAEMAFLRVVDNYLTYLTELLSEIFLARPETLRSSEQVKVDFVLGHASMDELIARLAQRKVDRLAFSGMGELANYFGEDLKLPLFLVDGDLERAVRLIEVRNLLVHNRGIVNERFKFRVRTSTEDIGSQVTVDSDRDDISWLVDAVSNLDGRALVKYRLKGFKNMEAAFRAGK
jgi:hypothetical protein